MASVRAVPLFVILLSEPTGLGLAVSLNMNPTMRWTPDALSGYAQLPDLCGKGGVPLGGQIAVTSTDQCALECNQRDECKGFTIWGHGTVCWLKRQCEGTAGKCAKPDQGCGYHRVAQTPAPTPAPTPTSAPTSAPVWSQPDFYTDGQGYGCLAGHNEGGEFILVPGELAECQALCIADPKCKSIDYYDSTHTTNSDLEGHRCNIGYATMSDASEITDTPGCHYYALDRNPQPPTPSPTRDRPTPSPPLEKPTPSPTFPTLPPLTPSPTAVQATGDPHLTNVLGQRFDLHREGWHTLVQVPKGAKREAALLSVEGEARQMGVACADMYFQSVNLTGRWVGPQGRVFSASRGGDKSPRRWLRYGKVQLKVVQGHTKSGIVYLNLYVRHLKRAGYPVGGILGMDDPSAAAASSQKCQRRISLQQIDGPLSPESASVAAADLE